MIKLIPDTKEALRYMGITGENITPTLQTLVDEAMKDCLTLVQPLFTHQTFPITQIDDENNVVYLKNTGLTLTGKDICQHLQESQHCVIMVVTLGIPIDRAIHVMEKTDMQKTIIYDACASSLIETLCDYVQASIEETAYIQQLYATTRFSPGYGDLPLDIQPDIINLLHAQKIVGLTVTPTNLLIPRKSVSAIIGLGMQPQANRLDPCEICSFNQTCTLKKAGVTCGK